LKNWRIGEVRRLHVFDNSFTMPTPRSGRSAAFKQLIRAAVAANSAALAQRATKKK
jgi:hypothetical protein